jgi:CubicO group peptidase (beta-lactamase class C family)
MDYFSLPQFDLRPVVISKDSMVNLLRTKLFNFLPGCDIDYSNSGYFLLAMIVEKVSGESFTHYVNDHLLEVAGMHNTGIDRYDTILVDRAKGYTQGPNGVVNAFDCNYTWDLQFGVGSMYSTVEDLYKWDKALSGNAVLSDGSKEKMYFQHGAVIAQGKKKVDPANTMHERLDPIWKHMGYGVFVDTFMTHKRIFTRGYVAGFKSTIYHFVDDHATVIVLQNNEESPDRIAEPLSAILFGTEVVAPYKRQPVKVDPEVLKNYVGRWSTVIAEEPWLFAITVHDGKLFRRIDDSPELELIPESGTRFFSADGQDKVFEFKADANGGITEAWFIMNGLRYPLSRAAEPTTPHG